MTREEIAAIITHATMYVGWPKGWAVFCLAKEVWNEEIVEVPGGRVAMSGVNLFQRKSTAD